MQLVNGQSLYDVAQSHNEIVGSACRDDGVYNNGHVGSLVLVIGTFVQQFFDDVGKLLWQRFANLATGVFRRHIATHLYQLVNGDVIPIVNVLFYGLHKFKLLLGVIDERAQLLFLAFPYSGSEYFAHLSLDIAGGIFQHMQKSLMLTMYVGQEVLGAFGQVEYGFQVDNFSSCIGNCRKTVR